MTIIQLQFINYLIKTKDSSMIELNGITNDFFSDFEKEFDYIKNHLESYGTIPDAATFATKFSDFVFIEVTEPPKYLITALFDDRKKRKLALTFNEVRDLVINNKTDEAIALYIGAAQEITEFTTIDCVDILKDTSRYDRFVEKIDNFDNYYVTTGFLELDEVIGGWDRREELATIVARPGVGKSWVLLKCALAAAEQGLTVGLYSGEMSEDKVAWRMDTLISHLPNSKILRGDISIQSEYKQFMDELPTKFKGSLKVITPQMMGNLATASALKAFIKKEKLDMLCIDQHSLLEDERKGKTFVEKASNISRDLKSLQVLSKIPIITVSQQNRDSTEGDGATTANVAQSDRISQDSTQLIFLTQKDSILTMDLVKTRDSVNGKKLKYAIELNRGILSFLPNEMDATNGNASSNLKVEYDGSDEF